MKNDRLIWSKWVDSLHKWGLNNVIASFLEAAGPLTFLAAQVIYIGQPLLVHNRLDKSLTALADMLEDPQETQAFISLLQEGAQHEPA